MDNNKNDATHVDLRNMQNSAHLHAVFCCVVLSFITPHGSRPFAFVFSFSSHPCTCVVVLECFSPSPSTSCCSSTSSSLFLMTDGDSVTVNNLRDSANGTFVTLDDYVLLTGYEPDATNATEFTDTTEFNDAVFGDINFQDSLDCTALSSDLYMDDDALGKPLAEVHRDYAGYRRAEGVSVSPSSVSVVVDRTGEPVERSDGDHFGFSVRNVKREKCSKSVYCNHSS